MKFSANLGLLWTELSLPDAIRAAKNAGFDAVECHWPYSVDASVTQAALTETGLQMLGLNTRRGNLAEGDFGVAAIPGREAEARRYIDEACVYAAAINCRNIHVMAGFTDQDELAESTFRDNLTYACDTAAKNDQTILIEPLNSRDTPGYHLTDVESAISSIESVKRDNIKLMFDCYHTQIMQGDIIGRLRHCLPYIAHVQIAAVPDRGEPDAGELDYKCVLKALDDMGYAGYIGAEYKPRVSTKVGLSWMKNL